MSTDSEYCFIRGESRKSQSINDTFHKLWIAFEKKTTKIHCAHCSCMTGIGQTCNHAAATLFRIEAMVRIGLTNPSCTSQANEWLPCKKKFKPSKLKNIDFSREDFGWGKKKKKVGIYA